MYSGHIMLAVNLVSILFWELLFFNWRFAFNVTPWSPWSPRSFWAWDDSNHCEAHSLHVCLVMVVKYISFVLNRQLSIILFKQCMALLVMLIATCVISDRFALWAWDNSAFQCWDDVDIARMIWLTLRGLWSWDKRPVIYGMLRNIWCWQEMPIWYAFKVRFSG